MTSDVPPARRTFAALAVPNFRRFFVGQAISLSGTWMQRVAQAWLVLELTGSTTAVGVTVGLQTLPILLLAPYGGLVADRMDKRRLILALQWVMAGLAVVLGLLTVTGVVEMWQIYLIALLLGLVTTFETPARHSFIIEMVGPDDLRNAVSLNSVLANLARAIGPAVAGLIIALTSSGVCFLLNAVTFVAVIALLSTLDVGALQRSGPIPRSRGQLRAGLVHVRHSAELAAPLLMMLLVGCLAYEFEVVLPALAVETFSVGPETYGLMTAAMGAGAVLGGLYTAARGRTGLTPLIISSAALGVAILLAAVAPTLPLELVALGVVGAVGIWFVATCNSTLQLASPVGARGRIIALWQVSFVGSRPIGAPIIGYVAGMAGARVALLVGTASCFAASGLGLWVARRSSRTTGRAVDHGSITYGGAHQAG